MTRYAILKKEESLPVVVAVSDGVARVLSNLEAILLQCGPNTKKLITEVMHELVKFTYKGVAKVPHAFFGNAAHLDGTFRIFPDPGFVRKNSNDSTVGFVTEVEETPLECRCYVAQIPEGLALALKKVYETCRSYSDMAKHCKIEEVAEVFLLEALALANCYDLCCSLLKTRKVSLPSGSDLRPGNVVHLLKEEKLN